MPCPSNVGPTRQHAVDTLAKPELVDGHQRAIVDIGFFHRSQLRLGQRGLAAFGSGQPEHGKRLRIKRVIFPFWRVGIRNVPGPVVIAQQLRPANNLKNSWHMVRTDLQRA